MTASKLPELLHYVLLRLGFTASADLPTHVRTPEGQELAAFGDELARAVSRRHGSPVEMKHLNRGIFDEANISVITAATISQIAQLAAQPPDVRRFRPNLLLASTRAVPFEEDAWVGGILSFGAGTEGAAIAITNRDERCFNVGHLHSAPCRIAVALLLDGPE